MRQSILFAILLSSACVSGVHDSGSIIIWVENQDSRPVTVQIDCDAVSDSLTLHGNEASHLHYPQHAIFNCAFSTIGPGDMVWVTITQEIQ